MGENDIQRALTAGIQLATSVYLCRYIYLSICNRRYLYVSLSLRALASLYVTHSQSVSFLVGI